MKLFRLSKASGSEHTRCNPGLSNLLISLVALSAAILCLGQIAPAFALSPSTHFLNQVEETNSKGSNPSSNFSAEDLSIGAGSEEVTSTNEASEAATQAEIENASSPNAQEASAGNNAVLGDTAAMHSNAVTKGPFVIEGGTEGTDYSYTSPTLTIHSGSIAVSTTQTTDENIVIDGASTITLAGVDIENPTNASPIAITENAQFDVTILLQDDSTNVLVAKDLYAGLEKSDDKTTDADVDSLGTLTIGVPANSIKKNGILQANSGDRAAGIGGLAGKNVANITIFGGQIRARSSDSGAGIGSGGSNSGVGGEARYITIEGGTIHAEAGGHAPGIGGKVAAKHICISGGDIMAIGIGQAGAIGSTDSVEDIVISGGTVITNGTFLGSGIGNGASGTADVKNITITGGQVTATGGVGIGSEGGSDVSNVKILGGIVEATGTYGYGIGGYGNTSGNVLNGDAVLIASTTNAVDEPLLGFDTGFDKGILFTQQGSDALWTSNVYGNTVAITTNAQDPEEGANIPVSFPGNLDLNTGTTVTLSSEISLTMENSSNLSVKNDATFINEGTVTNPENILCESTGKVTAKTNFYHAGTITPYLSGYQTYQTAAGIQNYVNLPNPDADQSRVASIQASSALASSSAPRVNNTGDAFVNWYYLNAQSEQVPIQDGDPVLLNEHNFWEKRAANAYAISVSPTENGKVQLNATEAAQGELIRFTLLPDAGYQVKEGSLIVLAGEIPIGLTDEGNLTYSFEMAASAVTIGVAFEATIPAPTPASDGSEVLPVTGETAASTPYLILASLLGGSALLSAAALRGRKSRAA